VLGAKANLCQVVRSPSLYNACNLYAGFGIEGGETESKEEQGTGQSESSLQKEAGLGDSYQTGSADNAEDNEVCWFVSCVNIFGSRLLSIV